MSKCQMCNGMLEGLEEDEPLTKVTFEGPEGEHSIKVGEICAASLAEYILEFREDVKNSFKDQDEKWRLRKRPYLQRKLPEVTA